MVRLFTALIHAVGLRICTAWRQWDDFWFRPEDPVTLGVVRILTGLMLTYTHWVWGIKFSSFFGTDGFQDLLLVRSLDPETMAWSFWWYVPPDLAWTVHLTCLFLLTMYTLGLWTSVTKWAAAIITISYVNRVPNASFGLDQMNAMLAVYLALGPCGARLSLDRLISVKRSAIRFPEAYAAGQRPFVLPRPSARLVRRLIQVHMCIIYFFAGVTKLKGTSWWDGNAVWMALANAEYQSVDMTWMAWYPWLSDLLTHATVLWEMTFWIFVWNPVLRPWVLLVGVLMHLGIGGFLGMWTFGLVMIFTYASFVAPEAYLAIGFRRRSRNAPPTVGMANLPAERNSPSALQPVRVS